ncbi:hypothetical protein COO09_06015 [Rhizorhabdus dicambivorans]|uniref:Uncharacterized protein n=2 Tax=Rhizorhabdus dicambivorans TaxID=1850238 RepID=A0A2A4G0U1_9SPHN|nr:hypothetical protein COO09_06015 [Rhizorhabdus dicambivorans]
MEYLLFGMAALMSVSWAFALITNWDGNIGGAPIAALIIAALVGIGLYLRKQRLNFYTSRGVS